MKTEVLKLVEERLARQKVAFPQGFPADRNGIRLGIASIEDETRELVEAWHHEKKRAPFDVHSMTFDELLDVIAVGIYIAEGMVE